MNRNESIKNKKQPKNIGLILMLLMAIVMACENDDPVVCPAEITDYDGNTYPVVTIGNQCWMAANMNTTHYADGTPVPQGADTIVNYQQDSAMYYFNYPDEDFYHQDYGMTYPDLMASSKMYTWAAATRNESDGSVNAHIQGICPDGWRLPNKVDWDELITYVGDSIAGKVLKTTSPMIWKYESDALLGTDTYGFNSIPGGGRSGMPGYYIFNLTAYYWSASTMTEPWRVWTPYIVHWNNEVQWLGYAKSNAFCVRCIKDLN